MAEIDEYMRNRAGHLTTTIVRDIAPIDKILEHHKNFDQKVVHNNPVKDKFELINHQRKITNQLIETPPLKALFYKTLALTSISIDIPEIARFAKFSTDGGALYASFEQNVQFPAVAGTFNDAIFIVDLKSFFHVQSHYQINLATQNAGFLSVCFYKEI